MAFKFFTVPIRDDGQAAEELNAFLRGRNALSVDRRWVEEGANSYWCFCVDYVETGGPGSAPRAAERGKIDYKEVLSPEQFAVFALLRDWRKEVAQAEGVPVYAIFTNEQLARMIQQKVSSKETLEKIAGIGDARVEQYGGRVLEVLARHTGVTGGQLLPSP